MWFLLNAIRSKRVRFLFIFLLNLVFSDIYIELFKNGEISTGYLVNASETSSSPNLAKLDSERKKKHPETAFLPRYPVPGMRFDEGLDSEIKSVRPKKKRKSGKAKKKLDVGTSTDEEGVKKVSKKKKSKSSSGSKSKKSSKSSTSSSIHGGETSTIGRGAEGSSGPHQHHAKHKSTKHKGTSTTGDFSARDRRKLDKSELVMSEIKSYLPGVDSIWQDPTTRKTYKSLNPQFGNYFPKVATKPYRKSNECSALFDSALKAFESKEVLIHPAEFVGLSLTLAEKLREVLGQFVTIQESCLMLRMLLHLYSGMRTKTQFLNIIAAVLQNDILLGRLSDDSGVIKEVQYVLDFILQLPKHRADTKSKQMSAIELTKFFHLETFPKDNSYESRLLPLYRRRAETLMHEIERRLGIKVARDEVMSMFYIMLNFPESQRSKEQCTDIVAAVIGATYTNPLTSSQLIEISNMATDIMGCTAFSEKVMSKDQIMEIFGPERTVVEMRQTALVGGPISDTLRIWKEVGTLDYLGRVISVRFNDCHGLKAWQLNRICSMMEVMNKKLIKTGSTAEIITLEELCGAFKYKMRHSGTKWSLAIKSTLQQRLNSLPVKVEKLFSHFLAHEKKKLAALEGTVKRKRETFYMVPEFPKPSFLDSITPSSPAQGIPPADRYKPDFFYTFNSIPSWLQNRFILASAFMEEILNQHGIFVHISPVRLYNSLGGKLDENSDISLVIQGLGLTQQQYGVLPAAFCHFEKSMFNEYNLNSTPMVFDEFLQAFYEYPLAKYVEGRYFIEALINVSEILNNYLISMNMTEQLFPQLITQERLCRVYLFQAFLNNRIKAHSGDGNIHFVTTEEANSIMINCVDNSKLSYLTEMRRVLSPTYFTDSLIDIMSQEWSDYENSILPQVLALDNLQQDILNSIYSSGIVFSVLSLDGWELLFDPTTLLRNLANGDRLALNYTTNSLNETASKENRLRFIYHWIQQYFIYKLKKIPRFNYEEVRALVEALPDVAQLPMDRIQSIIQEISSLELTGDLAREFSSAMEAYLFFEKYFIYSRSSDLEGSFATGIAVVNGKLYIPSFIWSFFNVRDVDLNSDINSGVVNFAETTLAYLTRLFLTQPQNQDFFIKVLEWANMQNMNDDTIFSICMLGIHDFQLYIEHNTKLRYNPHAFLIPWVDHYSTNYQFRRLSSLPMGASPGYFPPGTPSETSSGSLSPTPSQEDQARTSSRASEILSEIERLSLEHGALLRELGTHTIKEDTVMLTVEKIRGEIYSLLSELGTLSSTLLSSAMMILSKRMITPILNVSDTKQLADMGLQVDNNGTIIFDERLAEKGLSEVFTPALILGTINSETGVLEQPPPGFDPEFSCSTQNINRMQAFRLWLGSVLPRMPFHCADPLLGRDLLSIQNLLPVFTSVGFSRDPAEIASSLATLTASHPYPTSISSMTVIVKTFLGDESFVFSSLDPSASTLQEAYQGLRMIAGFYNMETTLPLLSIPTIYSFTPNLEVSGIDDFQDTESSSRANARINFLDYMERITAEYYASSPRKMPTIGIPRLNALVMNFSSDVEQLVFLISSIFGPTSPYISAPSIGASAEHLADFYLRNLPFSENMDIHHFEREFKTSFLEFGSPPGKVVNPKLNNDQLLDFKWTSLSAHFFSSDEAYFSSFLAMSDLILMALNYASSKTGVSINLSVEVLRQISFSFIIGQNLLEVFRTNIDLSSYNLGSQMENNFYSSLAKTFSYLISRLIPLIEDSDNRALAEGILQSAISSVYTGGFYPENVRHEVINRMTLFIDFDTEKHQVLFSYLEDSLNSENISVPKSLSSHMYLINQRFLTQRSDATLISGQSFASRIPICNFALTFAYFLTKTLEKQQNKVEMGNLDPVVYLNSSIWSDACGVSNFTYVDYKSIFFSIIRNASRNYGTLITADEMDKILLLMDYFDHKIREIIVTNSPNLSQEVSNEVLFSDLDVCIAAVTKFFSENELIVSELQMTHSDPLLFSDEMNGNHFSLFSRQEVVKSRMKFKSMLENLFLANIQTDLEDVPGIKRHISSAFFSDNPISKAVEPNVVQMETLDSIYEKVPFDFNRMSLKFGKKDHSSATFSYLEVSGDQSKEFYDLEGHLLHGKKIVCVNRAVFFQHWWLIVWPKIPFYTNDFVLAELLSRMDILSEAFQSSCMLTSSHAIFSSIAKLISGLSGVSLKRNHLYLMIEAFLESENQALEFSGAKDLESAYSNDSGMLNSLFAINHRIPVIPIPQGLLTDLLGQENKNLSQYLFRIISEYFAANPRNYPTIIIPNTSFLARHFNLDKKSLSFAIYRWSELSTETSIRAFFQAPTIGASYEDLADFIIENFKLNFLNFGSSSSYIQFFSDPVFSTFFKYGGPLLRVKNIQLGVRCSRPEENCNPFIPNLNLSSNEQKLLDDSLSQIITKCLALTTSKLSIPADSEILKYFSVIDVSEAVMLGINIFDAVRVHGFGNHRLQVPLVQINKFSLLLSKIFSRVFSLLLESFNISSSTKKLAMDLNFSQVKALSSGSFNILSQFAFDLKALTVANFEDLEAFFTSLQIEDLVPVEKYQPFYGVPTSDHSRGIMTVYTKSNRLPIHLQVARFNYMYCFILFLVHLLSRTGSTYFHISFKYHNLLNFENVVRATAISNQEGVPEAVFTLVSHKDHFSLANLTIDSLRQIYVHFKTHCNQFFSGGSVQIVFASSEALIPFVQSLFGVSKEIQLFESVSVTYLNEFEKTSLHYYSPKSQSLASHVIQDMLNINFHRDNALFDFKETSFITGSFVKTWVPFLIGLSSHSFSSIGSEASNDHLVIPDPGHVSLRRKIKTFYTLSQNLDLSLDYNSIVDLGRAATIESGVIYFQDESTPQDEEQGQNSLQGLRVSVLNRAVLFREWLIRVWDISPAISRDPLILEFLNDFDSIINIFNAPYFQDGSVVRITIFSHFFIKSSKFSVEVFTPIFNAFNDFEERIAAEVGIKDFTKALESGLVSLFLLSLPIYDPFPQRRCYLKNKAWGEGVDSQRRSQILEFVTQKLTEYLSAIPRSAFTMSIPDVSLILDNFSEDQPHVTKCVIEEWAKDRPDLISAPSIGLDPASIFLFLESFLTASELDQDNFGSSSMNYQLSYGFLDEIPVQDVLHNYGSTFFALREQESLYQRYVAPLLADKNILDGIIRVLMSISKNVLDTYNFNHQLEAQQQGEFGESYLDLSSSLDYTTFFIRLMIGVSESFSARKLFEPIETLKSPKDLNKVSSDFLRKLSVLKTCVHEYMFEIIQYERLYTELELNLQRSGINLTKPDTFNLFLNQILFNYLEESVSTPGFVTECFSDFSFHQRPQRFSTIPDLGYVSQRTGLITSSFKNLKSWNLQEVFVPQVNLLVYYLKSLNCLINHPGNKSILSIPNSINFMSANMVKKLSGCSLTIEEGFSCLAQMILNSQMDLGSDVGNLSVEALKEILESLFMIVGEFSTGSFNKLDLKMKFLDLEQNRAGQTVEVSEFNPNLLSIYFGDLENLERIISSRFRQGFVDVRRLSKNLKEAYLTDPNVNARLSNVLSSYSRHYSWNLSEVLDSIPAIYRGKSKKVRTMSLTQFFAEMGVSGVLEETASLFPTLVKVAEIRNGIVNSIDQSFSSTSLKAANRAAMFHSFAYTSTYPYLNGGDPIVVLSTGANGGKGIRIEECIEFFSYYEGMDILESVPFISKYFKNIEFYKAYQLLDSFFTLERLVFGLDGFNTYAEEIYSDVSRVLSLLDEFGPITADLEIPRFEGKEAETLGKMILLLGRKFFKNDKVKSELTLEKCVNIARHFWPLESDYRSSNSKRSNVGYNGELSVLEYLESTRNIPRLAQEFISYLNWYIYYMMGSDPGLRDFSDTTRIFKKRGEFLRRAFSKPFVCYENDLPWVYPEMEYLGITLPQFNSMMYIATGWKAYVEQRILGSTISLDSEEWSKVLKGVRRDLIAITDFSSYVSSVKFSILLQAFNSITRVLLVVSKRSDQLKRLPGDREMKDHIKAFLSEVQRFSRIRHPGVSNVSFVWPAIDCVPSASASKSGSGLSIGEMIVPGLSFPTTLNNIGSEDRPSGRRSPGLDMKEFYIDSLGEFFPSESEEGLDFEESGLEADSLDEMRVNEEIRSGIKLEDLPDGNDSVSTVGTDIE